jgi:uncharacterized protein with PIN domain
MSPIPPRFSADVHLAKLARHLRMVGLDVFWSPEARDEELARLATQDGRVLLTRDRALHESLPAALTHSVRATEPGLQLREVMERFGLLERACSGQGFLSRCLECNSPILPAQGDQIAERIPASIRLAHQEFFLCPRCERVYWKGSHFDRMQAWVKAICGTAN